MSCTTGTLNRREKAPLPTQSQHGCRWQVASDSEARSERSCPPELSQIFAWSLRASWTSNLASNAKQAFSHKDT